MMRADELMELFGSHVKAFRKIEEDHPVNPCYWCEQMVSEKHLAAKGLTGIEDKAKRWPEKSRVKLRESLERRLRAEGKGAEAMAGVFPMNICKSCWESVRHGVILGGMVENGFRTDPVPPELGQLNPYERMLVSLARPFYSCVRLIVLGHNAY